MYDIDFTIPYWLITYYHVIGTVSLLFDAFSIYLVLFESSKIDNFRYFLLNFQIACALTDIHLTFLMQPVPLYPLISGYILGYSINFGANTHICMTVIAFLMIYQIGSMITCFVRKHQAIAGTLKRYSMPSYLVFGMILYVIVYTLSVTGIYFTLSVPEDEKFEFVEENYPEYLDSFKSLPNFSIYEPTSYFANFVIYSLLGGIFAFLTLVSVILNIFRMLSLLKTKISSSTYHKHRTAVYSLIAQFMTSSVIFVPPIFFVFVLLIGINGAQVIVEYLVIIASFHSSLNSIVLIITFPPYRKFFINMVLRKEYVNRVSTVTQRPSVLISHLGK